MSLAGPDLGAVYIHNQIYVSAGKKLWSQSFLVVEKAGLWHLDITTTVLQLVFSLFLDITHMANQVNPTATAPRQLGCSRSQ